MRKVWVRASAYQITWAVENNNQRLHFYSYYDLLRPEFQRILPLHVI
jgi:hypothetical protein